MGNTKDDLSNREIKKWTIFYQAEKNYVHRPIFKNPQNHMDFILGLDSSLVYYVKQLWDEIELQYKEETPDGEQFLYYWDKIELYCYEKRYDRLGEIVKTANEWKKKVYEYQPDLKRELQEKHELERKNKTRYEKMLDKIYPIDNELV